MSRLDDNLREAGENFEAVNDLLRITKLSATRARRKATGKFIADFNEVSTVLGEEFLGKSRLKASCSFNSIIVRK